MINLLIVGASVGDGTGESLRVGGMKINAMFQELYTRCPDLLTGLLAADASTHNYRVATIADISFAGAANGLATLDGAAKVPAAQLHGGEANGVATLDGSGKLTASQIPASLVGALQYQGTWNAGTNTPALASGVGTKGQYYVVATAGTTAIDGVAQWNLGDWIVFDGTKWDKLDGLASEVLSVAGKTGAVALVVGDVSGAAPLDSPAFINTPRAPTQSSSDNSTLLATTAMVQAAVAAAVSVNRSVLMNSGFAVNQRAYVSGTALAAGAFGHDRWKGGAGGATYTFTQAAAMTQITITAGTLVQAIPAEEVTGGTYTLSWGGTAQARIAANGAGPSGAYAASPITLSGASANQQITLEFNTGTLQQVKLELGSKATSWEAEPYPTTLQRCMEFYEALMFDPLGQVFNAFQYGGGTFYANWSFRARKRALPTFALVNGSWVSATPAVNAGFDRVDFTNAGQFFLSGAANVVACAAISDL